MHANEGITLAPAGCFQTCHAGQANKRESMGQPRVALVATPTAFYAMSERFCV